MLNPKPKAVAYTKEFHQVDSKGKVRRWIITVKGNTVSMTDGILGGKLKDPTTHIEKGVNIGKANETSDAEQATAWAERQILLKTRHGYREVDRDGNFIGPELVTEIDFGNLPENFRVYKPLQHSNSYMQKMMDEGTAWWTRKRKGVLSIITVSHDMGLRMYPSTLQPHHAGEDIGTPWLERYPHLTQSLQRLGIPDNSIILGELCCTAKGGFYDEAGFDVDNQDYVNGVRGSLTPESLATQETQGRLGFCMWDILFWDGKCWAQEVPYYERMAKIIELSSKDEGWLVYPEICTVVENPISKGYESSRWVIEMNGRGMENPELYPIGSPDEAQKFLLNLAKERGWEGWVVVDPNSTYGDKAYNFRGKADRPKECIKQKPKFNADFWVEYDPDNGIGERGKGRKKAGIGNAFCYLWDPIKKEKVYVGKCGNGLSEEDVVKLANPALYPMVWEICFDSWTKTGNMEFAALERVRDDKTPEECTLDQRPELSTEEE
jgi:hypothetical protein